MNKKSCPWTTIKPTLTKVVILFDTLRPDWTVNNNTLIWLKTHILNAPKIQEVEIHLRFSGGDIDDRFVKWSTGKRQYVPGQKTLVERNVVEKLYEFVEVKRLSFAVLKDVKVGSMYTWYGVEINDRGWSDWQTIQRAW